MKKKVPKTPKVLDEFVDQILAFRPPPKLTLVKKPVKQTKVTEMKKAAD